MASERGTLVDTNVLLDVFTDDPTWGGWSAAALAEARDAGPLIINPLIYAELSIRFGTPAALDIVLDQLTIQRDPLPYEAGFPTRAAFVEYRRRDGSRTSTLPDFFIGAHAAVTGLRLLSRDAGRYAMYFPKITLVTPDV